MGSHSKAAAQRTSNCTWEDYNLFDTLNWIARGPIYWWYMSSAATLKERRCCPHWSMNLCVRDSMPITPRHPKGPVLFHPNIGKETWRWEALYCVYYRFNARYWEGNLNINFHPTDRKGSILSSLRNSVDFKNIYLKLPCTLESFLGHFWRYVERKVMLQLNVLPSNTVATWISSGDV